MPSKEELEEQERVFFQKIRELWTYLIDTRKIQGDIAVISYRYNSGIHVSHEQVQMKERLKRELKWKNAELMRNNHLSPCQVEGQLRQYEYEIRKIDIQVKSLLPWCYRHDIQDAWQEQVPPEIEGAGSKLEERYELEPEQSYKRGQEKQCGDNHSETINRQPRKKVTMTGCVSYMKMENRSILPVKEEGQRIMIPEFQIPDSSPGKVTHHSYGEEMHDFEKAPGHISVKFPYHSGGYGNPYSS